MRITCGQQSATVEIAKSLHDAEHNMYEDVDLYGYAHMAEQGFTDIDAIFGEIKADIVKYIVEAEYRNDRRRTKRKGKNY